MASLKEIKVRLSSIRSTQKITAAMKMVSSAKLHHTQASTEQTVLYADKLTSILNGLLHAECDLVSPYIEKREVKQAAIVAFSSSSGLCGAFNANVWRKLSELLEEYKAKHIAVLLIPSVKKSQTNCIKQVTKRKTTFCILEKNRRMKEAFNWLNA